MEQYADFRQILEETAGYGMSFPERRNTLRHETKDGFITITDVHVNAATTRLLNISRHGLAFDHISPLPLQAKVLEVSLLVGSAGGREELFLHQVKARIMSIGDIDGSWNRRGGRARRYGLRFVGLTPQQQYNLVQFLGGDLDSGDIALRQLEMAAH